MSATATIEPRLVKRGTLNETTGIYTLYLDNGTEVDTESTEVAETASKAAKAGKLMVFETEARGGRNVITQMSPAPAPEQGHSQKPDAVAKTEHASTRPSAAEGTATRPAMPTGLIHDPLKLTEQLRAMEQTFHVMSPTISIGQMAQGYGANLAVVQIDSTLTTCDDKSGTGPDTYWSRAIHGADKNKRSLRKEGLLKLCQAAGIQWVPQHCRRLDNGKQRYFWRWQYFGLVRTHDGQYQPVQGSKELDLRDGSPDAKACVSPQQLAKARQNGNEVCESKAMLRAIRSLRVQQSFTVEELKKPFLIVRFSFTPDMEDPEIKKAVTLQAMSGIASLYGSMADGPLAALPEPSPEPDDDPEDEPAAPAKPKPNPFADPQEGTPAKGAAPIGGRKVAKVEKKDLKAGPNAKQPGRAFTLAKVIFDNGEEATTLDGKLIDLAEQMQKSGVWVRVTLEPSPRYEGQMNLTAIRAVDPNEPDLPLDGDVDEERY